MSKKLVRKALEVIRAMAEEDDDEEEEDDEENAEGEDKEKTDESSEKKDDEAAEKESEEKENKYDKFWKNYGKNIKLGVIRMRVTETSWLSFLGKYFNICLNDDFS